MIFGASPMDPEWIRRVAAAFPDAGLSNSYGLTETAPDLTLFDTRDFARAIEANAPEIASVGKPNVLVELRIVDADGAEVAPGEPGELWARGPNVTKGYLNLPELSREVLAGGWLRTGDIGRIDAGGYVYLLDRAKDMVITGGENVYSSEVEAALYRHEDIHECAVIGVPDERLGEALFAVIVPRPGAAPDEHAIIEHCRQYIAGYKIPRRMAFVDAMPKSAMGKILKAELRAAHGG
jgi:long-chain acyl-CoA synthetase